MGYISRTHRARKPELLVLSHNAVQLAVLVGREADVLIVGREVLAEFVERRLNYRVAHPRQVVDASKKVTPAEYSQEGQHLQQQLQEMFTGREYTRVGNVVPDATSASRYCVERGCRAVLKRKQEYFVPSVPGVCWSLLWVTAVVPT